MKWILYSIFLEVKWQISSIPKPPYKPQLGHPLSFISFLLRFIVHGPGGVTMHPLRAHWEWYHIVPKTPLIKNQDVNNRYFGSHPPFWMVFKMAATKNGKIPI